MMFLFQKAALYKCNMAGKPAVVTRVVDSMTDNISPTRAEATDVANAVLDGDGILLGAETLRGLYPVETISIVCKICAEDDNRYNASRGAHLNLKRAEKARILVNKNPALVDTLVAKTRAWEEEHGLTFAYDGVPLLALLDEYALLRHDREEEKRRMRDQKKFHEQLSTEQEAMFGTRPSPTRPLST
ncbi:hypothetical protein QVD17_37212 [Tagetes erecta]|uniref:Pyruvate kinase n=1 Tax=Tagetes erecta TaxID=13708 RepID=A0AAD8NJV0_TARER|nr:hypothetical protein QVD17_37212 [Tagetes erecta]